MQRFKTSAFFEWRFRPRKKYYQCGFNIVIPAAENIIVKLSSLLSQRVSERDSLHKGSLLFRFNRSNITIIDSLVITKYTLGNHVKDFFLTKLISITIRGFWGIHQ